MTAPLVCRVTRGGVLESAHRVHAVVTDHDGQVLAAAGDPALRTFFRSSAKPLQTLPLIRTAADRLALTVAEIGITTGSHSGSARHVAVVRGLLAKAGLSDDALGCGFHVPRDAESAAAIAAGAPPSPVYNNCSGKHAGMLALAVSHGWPAEGYLDPAHPAQRMILEAVEEAVGAAGGPAERELGTDGCSAPTLRLPLAAIARGFARLTRSDAEPAMRRVRDAMVAEPVLVAGEGRFDTALIRVAEGTLVAKGGAESVYGAGLVGRGIGIALKVEDGGTRALAPAVVAALAQLGILDAAQAAALAEYARPEVRNHRGLLVGRIEADAPSLAPLAPAATPA